MRMLNLGASKKLLLAAASMAFAASVFCAPSFAFANDELSDQRADSEITRDASASGDVEGIAVAVERTVGAVDASTDVAADVIVEGVAPGDQAEPGVPAEGAGGSDVVAGDADAATDGVDDAVAGVATDEEADGVAGDQAPAAQEKEEQAAVPVVKDPAPAKKDVVSNSQTVKTETKSKASSSKAGSTGSDDIALRPQSSYTTVSIPKVHNYTYDGNYHCPFDCGDDDYYCYLSDSEYDYEYDDEYDEYWYYGNCWYPVSHYIHEYLAGSYRVTVALLPGCKWSDGTTDDKTFTWKISRKRAPLPVAKTGLVYNGYYQRGVANKGYYMDSTLVKKLPGTYSERIYLEEGYMWADGTTASKVVRWKIAPLGKLAKPTKTSLKFASLSFNGKSQRVNRKAYSKNISGSCLVACEPGAYTATFKPKAGYLWTDGTSSKVRLSWRIAKAKASSVKVKFPYTIRLKDDKGLSDNNRTRTAWTSEYVCQEYYSSKDGHTPEFAVFIGSKKLGELHYGNDYSWEMDDDDYLIKRHRYSNNVKAGIATITIRLNKEYVAGSNPVIKKTFTILPKNADGWVKSRGKWYYVGGYYGPWYKDSYGYWDHEYVGSIYPGNGEDSMGWKKIEGTWYFFSRDTYAMTTGLFRDKGKTYYCASSGAMQASCWKKVGKSWYYFGKSGAAYTGKHKIGGVWYKFDSKGKML